MKKMRIIKEIYSFDSLHMFDNSNNFIILQNTKSDNLAEAFTASGKKKTSTKHKL